MVFVYNLNNNSNKKKKKKKKKVFSTREKVYRSKVVMWAIYYILGKNLDPSPCFRHNK
jgi:hypothetical protein